MEKISILCKMKFANNGNFLIEIFITQPMMVITTKNGNHFSEGIVSWMLGELKKISGIKVKKRTKDKRVKKIEITLKETEYEKQNRTLTTIINTLMLEKKINDYNVIDIVRITFS